MRAWVYFCRVILGLTTVCVAFGLVETGQDPMKSMSKSEVNVSISPELRSEIISNETAVWEAAKRGDMRRFDTLVADDARMVFMSGVMTKQEYTDTARKRTITDYSLKDFQVFMPAEGMVITLYQATVSGTYEGKAFPTSTMRECSVWVYRSGKWVAVWNQETPIH